MTATYLNRLSDLLFVLARCANLPAGDVLWQPGGGDRPDLGRHPREEDWPEPARAHRGSGEAG